jgi:alkylation response protein AidB-like acyl-CoA dehydrogenase
MDFADSPERWFHRVLGERQYTIAGGTSEIQRNIIGERVLGLPKG